MPYILAENTLSLTIKYGLTSAVRVHSGEKKTEIVPKNF